MDELLDKYIDAFGDSFPMYQLARGRTEKQVMKLIQRCLDAKKDAYELGLVTLDRDVLY